MIPHDQAPEHEFEAAPGLPQPLPDGELLLWQGSPDWRALAREALHTRLLSLYFALLLLVRGLNALANGASATDALSAMLTLLPLAVLAIGVLSLLAWLMARTSVYTITDKRVVMRVGVVLTITFNLPFQQIESAALRSHRDGSGDLTLALTPSDHIAWMHLWPHARPWHLKRTQPMLRALPQARTVAAILSAALAEAAGVPQTHLPPASEAQRPTATNAPGRPVTA